MKSDSQEVKFCQRIKEQIDPYDPEWVDIFNQAAALNRSGPDEPVEYYIESDLVKPILVKAIREYYNDIDNMVVGEQRHWIKTKYDEDTIQKIKNKLYNRNRRTDKKFMVFGENKDFFGVLRLEDKKPAEIT